MMRSMTLLALPAPSARTLAAGLVLAAFLLVGVLQRPASAGANPSCCLCTSCIVPPFAQCVDPAAGGCSATCSGLACISFETVAGSCSTVPGCPQFTAPAPAPALAPAGLAFGALVLTGLGLRAMRRRH